MYERIFTMKFLPPGRGLWAMGTPITEDKGFICRPKQLCFRIYENTKGRLC